MAKFIIPDNVVKLPNQDLFDLYPNLFPIGTLYQVKDTNIYFRFLQLGGRWDTTYGISTNKGVLYSRGFRVSNACDVGVPITGDKNFIVNKLLKYLNSESS